jgi:hypothetical protein
MAGLSMAMRSPRWWPDEVSAGGHEKSPLVASGSPRSSLSIHLEGPPAGDGGGAAITASTEGLSMKSVRERMDINAAFREVGSYRGAAEICGTTPKAVKRVVLAVDAAPVVVVHNYDGVRELVAARVDKTNGRISAKRLLPAATARATRGRRVTSVGSSPRRRRRGAPSIIGVGARRVGGARPGRKGLTVVTRWWRAAATSTMPGPACRLDRNCARASSPPL